MCSSYSNRSTTKSFPFKWDNPIFSFLEVHNNEIVYHQAEYYKLQLLRASKSLPQKAHISRLEYPYPSAVLEPLYDKNIYLQWDILSANTNNETFLFKID